MLKFLITVVLLISLSNVAGGQTLAAMSREIADSVTAHNYLLAISKLRELKTKSPRVFEINNYDYLLGRMSERSGDVATAMFAYQVVAKSESVLKPYALWHLSKIARTAGNLILERMYVQELLSNSPDSLLSSAAKNRLARSYFESNDFLGALDTIDSIMPNGAGKKQGSGSSLSRENQVLAGRSLLQLGKTVEARVVFARLLDEMPNPAQPDDFSLAAAEGLDQIDRGAPSPLQTWKISDAPVFFNSIEASKRPGITTGRSSLIILKVASFRTPLFR